MIGLNTVCCFFSDAISVPAQPSEVVRVQIRFPNIHGECCYTCENFHGRHPNKENTLRE
ncbi:hypothetical protein PGS_00004060 [Porphyromonas gingivalis A7A1-28]|nr:hypothetical protein PGS_00004060 [Porphyromonas gingivalis A7A1-28]